MDKDTLDDDKEAFKLSVDAESAQREVSLDDLEFARLGKQWPQEVEDQRRKEGRPVLTINRLPAFIKQVTNDARQNRPAISVSPAGDGASKETALILNGLIRNIQNVSRADIAYDTGLDFAVTMGFGYWVIRDEYACEDSFDKDLVIKRVANPFSVYGDWRSDDATSADWNSAFITDQYSESEFKRKWPDADTAGFDVEMDEASQLWFEDKKIRVAERWTREKVPVKLLKMSDGSLLFEDKYLELGEDGFSLKNVMDAEGITVAGDRMSDTYKVTQRIISGTEILETTNWKGKYIPIVPVYGDEINVNGKRYFQSLVRFAKDPQRMFNYWRTASTEQVALASKMPWVGPVGSFVTDAAKWDQANNASLPYVEFDIVPGGTAPMRQPFPGVPPGALQEALNASDDLKNIMGLHDASLGARSNETSGVAIRARQHEGDVSTFNFTDNLNRAIEHTGTILVDLIPKHYDVPRIIRCIKEDGSNYSVPINQPVIAGPPQGPGMAQEQFQPAPEHIEGVTKMFDLTTGKYDVVVSAGPSFTTKRQESSEQMMEFLRVFPQAAPLIGDLYAKNQDWPGADEIAARLKAMLPPQAQGQAQPMLQQMQQHLQQQDQMAKQAVGQLQQQLQQLQQQLNDKTQENALKNRELDIKQQEAETNRIEAIAAINDSEKERQTRIIESANQASAAQAAANAQAQPNTVEQPPAM